MSGTLNPASVLATRGPLFVATALIRHRLQRAFPASHFQHGLLPAALSRELWLTTVNRTPYIGLTWLGAQPSRDAGRQFSATASWRVVLVNSNTDASRRIVGDELGPGQFAMVQGAIAALHGFTPQRSFVGHVQAGSSGWSAAQSAAARGPEIIDEIDGIGTFMVTEVTALTTEEWGRANDAVAGLVVTSDFLLTDRGDAPDLLRLRGSWAFEPHGQAIASAEYDTPPTGGSNRLDEFQLDLDQLG
jgi:hypothetical protein